MKFFKLRLIDFIFMLCHIVLRKVVALSVYDRRHLHRFAVPILWILLLDGKDKEFIISNFVPLFHQ